MTDANLVLGYLDPANFLGGETRLDRTAAERAVDAIATRLGADRITAARGIHQIANTQMAEGIRLVSVRRGVDPRRFTLLAFGGAAGLHITDVARQLKIRRVVLPRMAAVLSAWGMLTTDLRYEMVRTQIADVQRTGVAGLRRLLAEMEGEGRKRLRRAFHGPVRIHRALEMRYGEQLFEISVSLDGLDLAAPDAMARVMDRFHRRHEELYTYSIRDQEVVIVNARVTVVGELPEMKEERETRPRRKDAPARPPDASASLPGWLAGASDLRSGGFAARPDSHWAGDRRSAYDDGAPAKKGARCGHAARLAGYSPYTLS